MRYLLVWFLTCVAYAAAVAVALVQARWFYADGAWLVTLLAGAYALIVAIFARGPRQAAAVGFVVTGALVALCLHFSPDSVPTARFIVMAAEDSPPPAPRQVESLYSATMSPKGNPFGDQLSLSGTTSFGQRMAVMYREQEQWVARYRIANALATMLAGLAGCVLGATAYRRSRSPTPGG
jgi:hypothetical protein